MRLLPDFQPARDNPAFRRLLAGTLLSTLGGSMTTFAVTLQVWDLSRSARRTFMPQLLPAGQLRAGIALQTLAGRVTMLFGPALAGIVAGVWGLRACYLIDAVSFSAALYATARLPAMRAGSGPAAARPLGRALRPDLSSIAARLRFIRERPVIAAAFLTDLDAMLLGLPAAVRSETSKRARSRR